MKGFFKKIFFLWILFLLVGEGQLFASELKTVQEEPQLEISKNISDTVLNNYYNEAVKYLNSDVFNLSEEYFTKAVRLLDNLESYDLDLAYRIYANFGVLNKKLGKMQLALKYQDMSEKLIIESYGGNDSRLIVIYTNKGNIYNKLNNIIEAKKFYNKALYILNKSPKKDYQKLVYLYNNMGVLLYKEKRYKKALNYYFKALDIKIKQGYFDVTNNYLNIAFCYEKLKNYSKAEKYYKLCIDDTTEKYGEDYYLQGKFYMNYGVFLLETNKNKQAFKYFNKAYKIYLANFGEDHPSTALCLKNIGVYYSKKNNPKKALEYYQKALISESVDFKNPNIYTNPELKQLNSQISVLTTLKYKGNNFLKIYRKDLKIRNLKICLETYDLCLSLINNIRIAYLDEKSKFIISEKEKDTYNKSIEAALMLYEATGDVSYKNKAFEYSEQSKSAVLTAHLRNDFAKNFSGISVELQEQEKEIKKDISKFRELLYNERKKLIQDSAEIVGLKNSLFSLNKRYKEIVRLFENDYYNYYTLKYSSKTVNIDDLRIRLGENALIEYTVSDSILYLFVVSNSDFEIIRKPINKKKFDKSIKDVKNTLKSNNFSNRNLSNYKKYTIAAKYLYDILIKPAEDFIDGQELVIVPDEKLASIPFEILLREKAGKKINYKDLEYLIKDRSIAYQNSATLRYSIGKKPIEALKPLAAFAPSYDNVNDSILQNQRNSRKKLHPLPFAKNEVKNIAELITGDIFIDELATERNFKNNILNYDVIHLAMHTFIDDENPMFSKLVFSQQYDSVEDGLLNTYEIYDLNFNARMIVLSACNSGEGKLFKGEGVISLARGFFYAGCPSVVMTLWTVDDKSGANLMTSFYRYLSRGLTKDAALRSAKLKYLKNADPLKTHPYFWAGYVAIGDVTSLYENKLYAYLKYTILILLFVVPFSLIFRKILSYRSKKSSSKKRADTK